MFPSSCKVMVLLSRCNFLLNKSWHDWWVLTVQRFTHRICPWLGRFVRLHQSVFEWICVLGYVGLTLSWRAMLSCRRMSPFQNVTGLPVPSRSLLQSSEKLFQNKLRGPPWVFSKMVRSYHHLRIGSGLGDQGMIRVRSNRSGIARLGSLCSYYPSRKCKHRFPFIEKRGILSKLCTKHSLITFLFLFFGFLWGKRPLRDAL